MLFNVADQNPSLVSVPHITRFGAVASHVQRAQEDLKRLQLIPVALAQLDNGLGFFAHAMKICKTYLPWCYV